eukprot:COSAG06_NODE_63217_length_263_cov_0.524390_1_plen_73_part_01
MLVQELKSNVNAREQENNALLQQVADLQAELESMHVALDDYHSKAVAAMVAGGGSARTLSKAVCVRIPQTQLD